MVRIKKGVYKKFLLSHMKRTFVIRYHEIHLPVAEILTVFLP